MSNCSRLALTALAAWIVLGWTAVVAGETRVEIEPGPSSRPAAGAPFLWRIEGPKPSWLYGTIHVPDERVLALPTSVDRALAGCDRFFAEMPMDMATQIGMMPRMMLPDGQVLSDVLPPELYKRLNDLFASKGLPLATLERLKIWTVAVQAVMLDHMMEYAMAQPLDMVLYSRAAADGKEVGGLETVEEQLDVFDGLSRAEQIVMLERTLDQLAEFSKQGRDVVVEMIDAYVAGDGAELMELMNQGYDDGNEVDRKLLKRLLDDRNVKMADRIKAQLDAAPGKSQFFAVGAAHIVADGALVEMLTERGLKLRRVPAE